MEAATVERMDVHRPIILGAMKMPIRRSEAEPDEEGRVVGAGGSSFSSLPLIN
jgi:hypothetical protein